MKRPFFSRSHGPEAGPESAALDAEEPWALRNGKWIVTVGGTLTVIVGLLAVFVLPTVDWIVGDFSRGDLQRARADARASGLALGTGVAVATAGLLAWSRLELARRQHQLDRQRSAFDQNIQSQQHALAEVSQRSERFAGAVELLGHDDSSVRLGALYALEGLARDGFDRQTVYDVVSAFARTNSPRAQAMATVESFETPPAVAVQDGDSRDNFDEVVSVLPADEARTDDYEAAVTICLRAPPEWELLIDMRGAVIVGRRIGDMTGGLFTKADLIDCYFDNASLVGCSFRMSTLTRCRFAGARLVDCRFNESFLNGCTFREAILIGGALDSAEFTDCRFDGAVFDSTTSWPAGFTPDGAEHKPSLV
jgi:hypothetical protein